MQNLQVLNEKYQGFSLNKCLLINAKTFFFFFVEICSANLISLE